MDKVWIDKEHGRLCFYGAKLKDILEFLFDKLHYPKDKLWVTESGTTTTIHTAPHDPTKPTTWAIEHEEQNTILTNIQTLPPYGQPEDAAFAGLHLMKGIAT